jgi:hypothetical protein
VVKRFQLPEGTTRGIGWWKDSLAVTQGDPWKKDPRRVLLIDPDTGDVRREISFEDPKYMPIGEIHMGGPAQVDGKLWVIDSFFGHVNKIDPEDPDFHKWHSLAGPLPVWIADLSRADEMTGEQRKSLASVNRFNFATLHDALKAEAGDSPAPRKVAKVEM